MQIGLQNVNIVSRSYVGKRGLLSLYALQIQNKTRKKRRQIKEFNRNMENVRNKGYSINSI